MENANYKNKNIDKKYSSTWYDWLINCITDPINFFQINYLQRNY